MSLISRLIVASACLSFATFSHPSPVTSQGTWWGTNGTDGTLRARDINGNAVALNNASAAFFYDTALNVTWLGNGNAAAGTPFDTGPNTTDGRLSWEDASAWAGSLTTGGFSGWRLPTTLFGPGAGCNLGNSGTNCGYNVQTQAGSAFSELAYLFQVTLGNLALFDTAGNVRSGTAGVDYGLVNTGTFVDLVAQPYWYGTASGFTTSWTFDLNRGFQGTNPNNVQLWAIAVRNGDVLAVPEPVNLLLFLTGLAGLGVALHKRRAA